LIDNATLTTTPALITRQRQNIPGALSRGIEADIELRWKHITAQAAYLFAEARTYTGQRIAEVPKQQGAAQLFFHAKGTRLSGGLRATGLQFDDDLNQYLLPGFATLGLTASRRITPKLSALAAVDNLLDRSYLVALTPNANTGQPRIWRIGLRWSGPIH
jgi:outer membrane receptor protein involved in Fe transport